MAVTMTEVMTGQKQSDAYRQHWESKTARLMRGDLRGNRRLQLVVLIALPSSCVCDGDVVQPRQCSVMSKLIIAH